MMTHTDKIDQLDKLLSEAFITVRDNYGMPNSREVAEYLLDNGVEIHYMKNRAKCYRIISSYECTDLSNDFCIGSCDECNYGKRIFKIKESFYSAIDTNYCDDNFGETVFATKEEAETKLQEMLKGEIGDDTKDEVLEDAIEKVLSDFMIYQLHNTLGRYLKFRSLVNELKKQSVIDDFSIWSDGDCINCRVYKNGLRRQFRASILSDKVVAEIKRGQLNSISLECTEDENEST